MIPTPFVFLLLALGVYRLVRLIGWDDFPPIVKVRNRITGLRELTYFVCPACGTEREDPADWVGVNDCLRCGSAQKPEEETVEEFARPTLETLITCPFCAGAYVSLAAYLSWLSVPTLTLYVTMPFALSAVVGLTSKNLDA